MQVTETLNEGLKRGYQFVVPDTLLSERVEERLAEEQPKFHMNGFRTGKVPVSLMRRLYGKQLRDEVRDAALRQAVEDHLGGSDEKLATSPNVQIQNNGDKEGEDLSFSVTYEAYPEIPEIDFGSIAVERLVVSVDEDTVQKGLERVAHRYGSYEDTEPDARAELGDMVVMDFRGLIDGEEFEEGKGEGFPVELGKNLIAPGFDEQLVSAQVGSEIDVKVTYPDGYRIEALQGKEAVFFCTVKELKKWIDSPVDQELVTKAGFENLEDLKEEVRRQMDARFSDDARQLLKIRLFDRLCELLEFELPPSLLARETMHVTAQLGAELKAPGDEDGELTGSSDDANSSDDEAGHNGNEDDSAVDPPEEHTKIAGRRLRLGMLLDEIGNANGIEVSEQDLEAAARGMAKNLDSITRFQHMQYFYQDRGFRSRIANRVFEEKVFEFMLELVEVNDKEVSEDGLRDALASIEE